LARGGGPEASGSLAGRTILVTGGTSGTGLAVAIACHRLGAEVVIGTRSLDSYKEVAAELGDTLVRPFIADIGDRPSLERALDELDSGRVRPTDIIHCAAGGLEPILRPLLRLAAGLRRLEPGPERDDAIRRHEEEIKQLVQETSATAVNVNLDGPRHMIARLAPTLPDGARIVVFASVWSDGLREGACPAFYGAIADTKTRFEVWLDTPAKELRGRRILTTVLVGHIVSDTSTGKLIDRNIVPLMSSEDQALFRAGYVTTAEMATATISLLTEPEGQAGTLRRVFLVGSERLRDDVDPEMRAVVGRVPL
jgi:NAD(P)-dependent dehydrogenase (short-subunit alcohol dehydrogenase family)